MKLKTYEIPLNQIMEDPFLTPEALQIKNHFHPSKTKVEKYLEILQDLKFSEILKVWNNGDGKYYLFDNYECYLAFRQFYQNSPSRPVICIVVEGGSIQDIKALSLQLKNLSSLTTHTGRCLNILLLKDQGLSGEEIKRLSGIKKSHSAEGRQFQRDYRIVKHPKILNRIMGWHDTSINTSAIVNLLSPYVSVATLPYALADKILSIISDDPSQVEKFDTKYQDYLESLKKGHIYEEEQVKPIFTWREYSKKKVEAIAIAVARNGEKTNFDINYLLGDPEKRDQKWGVDYNENTCDMKISQASVNLGNKSDSNLKKILDLRYKMELLHHSLDSYIKRIRPVEHGRKIRLQTSEIAPLPETQSNTTRLADFKYFEFIHKNKMLYYCNRELLLKSIDLRAHHFGFPDYDYSSESTYGKAWEEFKKWYDTSFLSQIELHFNGNKEKHPRFEIYIAISTFLERRRNDEQSIYFGEFINEVFAHVFQEWDRIIAARREEAEIFIRSEQKMKTVKREEISKALEKAGLSEKDFQDAARDLLAPEENRLTSETRKLKEAVNLFVKQFNGDKAD